MLIIAQVLKEKWLKITGFAHSQTTNKLVNEAGNDSARVSGQDRKKPPALGTNQTAGFGGFCPLANKIEFVVIMLTTRSAHCICFYGFKQDQLTSTIVNYITNYIFLLLKAIYIYLYLLFFVTIFEKYTRS